MRTTSHRVKTILIIENDKTYQSYINEYVDAQPGVSLLIKEDTPAALVYLDSVLETQSCLPSLLLADYQSILNGDRSLFDELQTRNLQSRIPVIALSTLDEQRLKNEAYGKGAASYFIKPKDQQNWCAFFDILIHYWFNAVTLPEYRLAG